VKLGRVAFEICERTDKQTNRHADHNTSPIHLGRSK